MTETEFQPPFKADEYGAVYDAANKLVTCVADESGFDLPLDHSELIVTALNFYYAKKGEKE